jgi:hypothetical protein
VLFLQKQDLHVLQEWAVSKDGFLFYTCSTATNVEIEVPVPSDATNPNIRTSMGSAAYAPERDAMVWKVKSFPGGKVTTIRN